MIYTFLKLISAPGVHYNTGVLYWNSYP